MKRLTLALFFVACVICVSAQPSLDLEKEKAELLRLHKLEREAHFKTDVDICWRPCPKSSSPSVGYRISESELTFETAEQSGDVISATNPEAI